MTPGRPPRVLKIVDDPDTRGRTRFRVPEFQGGPAGVRKWVAAAGAVDIVHADGPASVRAGYLLAAASRATRAPARLVAAGASDPGPGPVGWLTRRALRSAARVVARTGAEAGRYRALGVPAGRVEVIPPAAGPVPPADPGEARRALGIPPAGRVILAGGRFDPAGGLREAVWAFDVAKYVAPDVYLVVAGAGPDRGRVERFARAVGFDDYRVRFADGRPDPALVGLAEIVWVTDPVRGLDLAAGAMAAGKPVVGFRSDDLAEVVGDAGRLVPARDRVRLAAVTAELLADPGLAGRVGAAGRARAADRFAPAAVAARWAGVYDGVLRE